MSLKFASATTTYELTVPQLKSMMAKELGVEESKVSINFKTREAGDDRFGMSWKETYALEIIVRN